MFCRSLFVLLSLLLTIVLSVLRFTELISANDKVYQLLANGRWFSPGTLASSTTKTGRHDIDEILLKVALNTKHQSSNRFTDSDNPFSIFKFFLHPILKKEMLNYYTGYSWCSLWSTHITAQGAHRCRIVYVLSMGKLSGYKELTMYGKLFSPSCMLKTTFIHF